VSAGGAFRSETVTIIRLAGGYCLLVGSGQAIPSSSVLERLAETLNDPGGSASGERNEGGDEEEG